MEGSGLPCTSGALQRLVMAAVLGVSSFCLLLPASPAQAQANAAQAEAQAAQAQAQAQKAEAELKDLQAQNAIAAARFGTPVTPPKGEITGAKDLSSLALLMEPGAYQKLAGMIAQAAPGDAPSILVTARANIGLLMGSAAQVARHLESLGTEGRNLAGSLALDLPATDGCAPLPLREPLFGASAPALLSSAGAIDELVGLFRADYTVSTADLDANELGLQLALVRELTRSSPRKVRVDGLDLYPGPSRLSSCIAWLSMLDARIEQTHPAANSPAAIYHAAVDAVLAALQKPTDTGVSSAAQLAGFLAYYDLLGDDGVVLYVQVVEPAATGVTARRLFSLNNKATLYFSALVNAAYQGRDGSLQASDTYKVAESSWIDFRRLRRDADKQLRIETAGTGCPTCP